MSIPQIYEDRAKYSRNRLTELRNRLFKLRELADFPSLTIFGVGSYARLEAGPYSDIDLFFLSLGDKTAVTEPRTKSLRMFGRLIEIADDMSFPKFSNDCQYLVVLHTDEMTSHLGSPKDDHENYFTARMLLLLESYCIYGDDAYQAILDKIVESYFNDFPDHKHTFQPIFLLNDICRFWKTLLLNYEHKRDFGRGAADEKLKTRQKVRNFKLKYSRMTTCFASIAALGAYDAPVTKEQVLELTKLTPRERLESISERVPDSQECVDDVLARYATFLELTGLRTEDLEERFSDKEKRTEMFQAANAYGDSMFRLLQVIDSTGKTDARRRLLRTLVI
jgi:predicted nucleotidyltransferase